MKLSTITAPPATVYSRREWSEAKLRRMQLELNAGMLPRHEVATEINVVTSRLPPKGK
jgi:hypothetical protein